MNKLNGYLFAKLGNIGTRSEGTDYYLQQYDYSEHRIIKHVNLWENDPVLHPLIGQKVVIKGTQQADGIIYSQCIRPDQTILEALQERQAELTARVEEIAADLSQKHSADSGDQAVERENDEVLIQLRENAAEELNQIKAAKQRIDEGLYHQCQMCDEEIPDSRLTAVPYTTLCLTCSNMGDK